MKEMSLQKTRNIVILSTLDSTNGGRLSRDVVLLKFGSVMPSSAPPAGEDSRLGKRGTGGTQTISTLVKP